MGIPLLLILVIIFLIVYNIRLRLSEKDRKTATDNFLEKERKAQFTRKKKIPSDIYIKLQSESLPFRKDTDPLILEHPDLSILQSRVSDFFSTPMVNLQGRNNTDLKLLYGAPNLEHLISCEQSYFLFLNTLIEWGVSLADYKIGNDAIQVLEYAQKLQCDQSKCFLQLTDLYASSNNMDKLKALQEYLKPLAKSNLQLQHVLQHIEKIISSK